MTLTIEDANRILEEAQKECMKNPSHNWTELQIDDHPTAPFRRLIIAKRYFADGSIGEDAIADDPASLPGDGGNARMLIAAYNAFDSAGKALGCNAVELSERMQGGGISDLLTALISAERWIAKQSGDGETDFRGSLLSVIAKVKGGVS